MKLRTTMMLTLISSALALGVATAGDGKMGGKSHDMNCPSMGMMDSTERAEKHLGELKAALKLTKDQEPAWQTFSDQVKAQAKSMASMHDKKKEGMKDMPQSAPEKMAVMSSMMKDRAQSMSTMADNAKTFYATLTPEQKVAFDKMHMSHMGHMGHTEGMEHMKH